MGLFTATAALPGTILPLTPRGKLDAPQVLGDNRAPAAAKLPPDAALSRFLGVRVCLSRRSHDNSTSNVTTVPYSARAVLLDRQRVYDNP